MPGKPKKKLTAEQRAARDKRRKEFMIIFVNGKQKRVKRVLSAKEEAKIEEFIRHNADPIWLHQNEMWEYLEQYQEDEQPTSPDETGHIHF